MIIGSESIIAPWGFDFTDDVWMIMGKVYGIPVSLGPSARPLVNGAISGYEIQLCVYGIPLKFKTARTLRVLGDHDFCAPDRFVLS